MTNESTDLLVVEDATTTGVVPIPISEQQCDLMCTMTHTVDPITCSCMPLPENNQDAAAGTPTDETSLPEDATVVDEEDA